MKKDNYTKIKKHLEVILKGQSKEEIAALGTSWIKYLAVYFAVVTGSRPSEAAHVIFYKTIGKNDRALNKRWGKIDNMATMVSKATKTHKHYTWLIPRKRNWFVKLVQAADTSCCGKVAFLADNITPWFHRIRDEAGVPSKEGPNLGNYNLRSVRCYQATKWVKLCAEYKVMGWDMPPENPLQHTTPALARSTYAEADAADENQARRRCIKKYKEAKAHFKKKGITIK